MGGLTPGSTDPVGGDVGGPPPAVLVAAALGGAAVLALVGASTLTGGAGRVDAFETVAAALAGVGAVLVGLSARPAWPLSIGLALGAFSGHWDTMGVPLPLDRLFVITGIVSTLVRARARRPDALRTRPLDWLLAVVALYAVGSTVLAGTLDDHTSRYALIDRFSLMGFVLFFVAPIAFRTARDRDVLLGCLVALGGYLGLTALLETTGPESLIVPGYITDPTIGTHPDRARGPFAEAAANGLVLYMCAVAAALAAFTWRSRRARQVAVVVAGLCLLGVLLTVTRAAWIAAVAATLLTMVTVPQLRRFVIPALLAGGAGVLVAFALVPGLSDRAESRADDKPPVWDRRNSTAAALRMVEERPLVGFGWGRFATDSLDYYRQSRDIPLTGVRNLHNVYLSNAVELGLLGTTLWLVVVGAAILGTVARRGPPELRGWRIALLAVAACAAVSAASTPLGFALPTLLLWTFAGVARGPAPPAR